MHKKLPTPESLTGLVNSSGIKLVQFVRNSRNYGLKAYIFSCTHPEHPEPWLECITLKYLKPDSYRKSLEDFTPAERTQVIWNRK
jgi:hypothetical protein